MLRQKGAKIFDADRLVHSLYADKNSRVYRNIARTFPTVLTKQKRISHRKLERLVSTEERALYLLENIVHPAVIKGLTEWVRSSRKQKVPAAAEVPLLFEKKLEGLFDAVIVVKAKDSVELERICKRFHVNRPDAAKKLAFARRRRKKKYPARWFIHNNAGREELEKRVNRIWRFIIHKDKP